MKKDIIRPPTKKRVTKTSPSDPMVSLRDGEKSILIEMSKVGRMNVNGYSDYNKVARSTTRTRIKKLARLGLVDDKFAEKSITKRGMIYLENTNRIEKQGVVSSRQEGRKEQLSTHWHKFQLPITNKSNFNIASLDRLNHKGVKENKLRNLHQTIIVLDDAKIVIGPKQVIINLFDVITDNVEDSDLRCLDRAVEYAEKLKSLGLETSGVMLERGHWARLESQLADFLYTNVDKRYYLELEDGAKFFIDCSGGKPPEDETDSKVVRERVDNFLTQVASNDFDLSDINKTKEVLGFITKLEAARLMDNIEENKLKRLSLERKELITPHINREVGYIR